MLMVVVAVAAVVVVVVVVAVAVAVAVTVVEGEILFVVSSGLPSQYCSITAAIATETFSKESQSPQVAGRSSSRRSRRIPPQGSCQTRT